VFQTARQMLQDWAVGSQIRKIDEWILSRSKLPDKRLAIVRALVTHQRHALGALLSCDFIRPADVLRQHPMVCSTLERLIDQLHKDGNTLTLAGTVPWLFTMQAVMRPQVHERGVNVWKLLERGSPYLDYARSELGEGGGQLNLRGFADVPLGFRQ
jgi:hypothetical protein